MIIERTKLVFHLMLLSENFPNAQCVQVMEPDARDVKVVKLQIFHSINLESKEDVIRGSQDPQYRSTIPSPSPTAIR